MDHPALGGVDQGAGDLERVVDRLADRQRRRRRSTRWRIVVPSMYSKAMKW